MKYYYREHLSGYRRMKAEGKKSWGEVHGNLDGFEHFSSRTFLEEALPRLRFSASKPVVLEYGCGTGPGACFLAQRGFQVDGIDLIPTAIEVAKELAEARSLDIHYEVRDICKLPHEGKKYDMIVDSYCLQGIVTDADREQVFSVVRARLKPEGYYLISTAMYTEARDHQEDRIVDPATGKVFTRYVVLYENDIFDRDTEIFYKSFTWYQDLEDKPEDYEDVIKVGDVWYAPNRRYRTPQTLKAELEAQGFNVLYQGGEEGEHAICALQGSGTALGPVSGVAGVEG